MIRSSVSANFTGRSQSFISFLNLDNSRPYDEQAFVGCAAYIRSTAAQGDILIQAPLEWHERYGNEKELKRWEKHIKLLGGEVTYQGIKPYQGNRLNYADFVPDWNKRVLQNIWNAPLGDTGQFITKNEWVQWHIPRTALIMNRYYTFCLLRYLYNRHLSPIVDLYYDIRKELPKVQCFKVLQLAHHMYKKTDAFGGADAGYCATWSVFDINVRHFLDKEVGFKKLQNNQSVTLHNLLSGSLYTKSVRIKQLLLDKEYKKAYDELNR